MKKFLLKSLFLLCALVVGSNAWATADVEYNFSSFTSEATVTLKTDNDNLTITLAKNNGSTNPAWSSNQARLYAKGSLTIASANKKITQIVYTYVLNKGGKNNVAPTIDGVVGTTSAGTWVVATKTWTGEDNEVTFSTSGSAGNVGFTKIEVTYKADNRTAVNLTSFTATNTTLSVGEQTTTAVSNDQNGWTAAYTYSSDDEDVATIDNEGNITGVAMGTTKVWAELNVANNDATYKVGTTYRRSIDVTVVNPSHNVAFSINGETTSPTSQQEGTTIIFPTVPAKLGGKNFVGWTTSTIDGMQDSAPATLITTATTTMGTSDITYYAVYATAGKGEGNVDLTITTSTTNFPASYASSQNVNMEGKNFNVTQAYINGTKLQWKASEGTIYNVDALNKIQSIVLTYNSSDNNKNFTVSIGDAANPASGTSITPTSNDLVYTFDCSSHNKDYFVLKNGSGAGYLTSLKITYRGQTTVYSAYCTTMILEATTVDIDATGITNTEAYTSNIGGFLTATVYNSSVEAIDGAKVSWSSSDKTVATIGSDGSVTLIGAGTTTIAASYAGGTGLAASEDTYNLTVSYTNPNAVGTVNNPYTVAQAISQYNTNGVTNGVYVKGIVTRKSGSLSSGKQTYYISDDGTTSTEFEIYQGKGLSNENFTSGTNVEAGDKVVVYGTLSKFDEVCELTTGNYLISKMSSVKEVGTDGWATYITEDDIEFEPENAFVVRSTGTNIVLSEVTQVPSGTPLVLKGEGKKYAAILTTTPAAVTNLLEISDGAGAGTTGDYVLGKKDGVAGFYKWNGGDLSANKVYLPAGSAARDYLEFSFDNEETTGVNEVRSKMSEVRGEFYNLAGQRVAQPTKGLYIVNRRKVVVK